MLNWAALAAIGVLASSFLTWFSGHHVVTGAIVETNGWGNVGFRLVRCIAFIGCLPLSALLVTATGSENARDAGRQVSDFKVRAGQCAIAACGVVAVLVLDLVVDLQKDPPTATTGFVVGVGLAATLATTAILGYRAADQLTDDDSGDALHDESPYGLQTRDGLPVRTNRNDPPQSRHRRPD